MISVSSEKAKVSEMKKIVGYLEDDLAAFNRVHDSLLEVNEGILINELMTNLDIIRIKLKNEIDNTMRSIDGLKSWIDYIYEQEQAELMKEESEC